MSQAIHIQPKQKDRTLLKQEWVGWSLIAGAGESLLARIIHEGS